MAQTDRQTDKATHWNTALYDEVTTKDGRHITGQWELVKKLPVFVKELKYQEEVCPTTGRHHYQMHVICHRQQRLSALTGWIKYTEWRPVKSKDHIQNSINYTSKTESAVPGTHKDVLGEQYLRLHEIMQRIAREYCIDDHAGPNARDWEKSRGWERLTSRLVFKDPTWASKLANPAFKKAWDWWGDVFLRQYRDYCEETSGAYIIEGPASEEDPVPEECLIE